VRSSLPSINIGVQIEHTVLTHYRPAMPFGDRKKYFKASFQFSIVTIYKISPLWKPKIEKFRHFSKFEIAYFNGKNPTNFS